MRTLLEAVHVLVTSITHHGHTHNILTKSLRPARIFKTDRNPAAKLLCTHRQRSRRTPFAHVHFAGWIITWTPTVCRIIAFYRFWAIIVPTLGGLGLVYKCIRSELEQCCVAVFNFDADTVKTCTSTVGALAASAIGSPSSCRMAQRSFGLCKKSSWSWVMRTGGAKRRHIFQIEGKERKAEVVRQARGTLNKLQNHDTSPH